MQGYQLTFFTQQDRRHGRTPLGEWLLQEALKMGVGGATLTAGAEGFGHHRKIHSVHLVDLADQPLEVTMAVSAADAQRMLDRLREEKVNVFYVKAPIEFGMTGEP